VGTRRALDVVWEWPGAARCGQTAVIEPAATALFLPPPDLCRLVRRGGLPVLVSVAFRVGSCGGVPEVVMSLCCLTTTDDLAGGGSCGIPSTVSMGRM
jgi:hypothetical protein